MIIPATEILTPRDLAPPTPQGSSGGEIAGIVLAVVTVIITFLALVQAWWDSKKRSDVNFPIKQYRLSTYSLPAPPLLRFLLDSEPL